jgi:hypothetical protein
MLDKLTQTSDFDSWLRLCSVSTLANDANVDEASWLRFAVIWFRRLFPIGPRVFIYLRD